MKYDKQTVIDGLKRTIEQTEARIIELSEPCVKSLAFSRSEERDLLKKKVKNWKKRIKELEDEMNISIFNRTNKGVIVSLEGDRFLGYARQVLEQTDLLEEEYKKGNKITRHFSVSAQHYSVVPVLLA